MKQSAAFLVTLGVVSMIIMIVGIPVIPAMIIGGAAAWIVAAYQDRPDRQ